MTLLDYVRQACDKFDRMHPDRPLGPEGAAYVVGVVRVELHRRPDRFNSMNTVAGKPARGLTNAISIAIHAANRWRAAVAAGI